MLQMYNIYRLDTASYMKKNYAKVCVVLIVRHYKAMEVIWLNRSLDIVMVTGWHYCISRLPLLIKRNFSQTGASFGDIFYCQTKIFYFTVDSHRFEFPACTFPFIQKFPAFAIL